MDNRCAGCGGPLEPGTLRARNMTTGPGMPELGMVVSAFAFIRPGTPTSANPVKALLQGLREEPEDVAFDLVAFRCTGCGRLELYAPG
jgi:hypothetical protein